jgi:hypothetical protein
LIKVYSLQKFSQEFRINKWPNQAWKLIPTNMSIVKRSTDLNHRLWEWLSRRDRNSKISPKSHWRSIIIKIPFSKMQCKVWEQKFMKKESCQLLTHSKIYR